MFVCWWTSYTKFFCRAQVVGPDRHIPARVGGAKPAAGSARLAAARVRRAAAAAAGHGPGRPGARWHCGWRRQLRAAPLPRRRYRRSRHRVLELSAGEYPATRRFRPSAQACATISVLETEVDICDDDAPRALCPGADAQSTCIW